VVGDDGGCVLRVQRSHVDQLRVQAEVRIHQANVIVVDQRLGQLRAELLEEQRIEGPTQVVEPIVAFLEQRSILNIMVVIGLTSWTGVARLVRGEVLRQKEMDYVSAARALGLGDARIILRHVLPNAMAPVLVSATFGVAGAILTESGLSFLGLGVQMPTPSWGQLLNEAREGVGTYWWLTIWPGVMIFFAVTIYNLVGEGLRDALDPRLRT